MNNIINSSGIYDNLTAKKATIKKFFLVRLIKKYILVRLPPLILQFIRMNKGNKDISIDTKQMKIGQNLA